MGEEDLTELFPSSLGRDGPGTHNPNLSRDGSNGSPINSHDVSDYLADSFAFDTIKYHVPVPKAAPTYKDAVATSIMVASKI